MVAVIEDTIIVFFDFLERAFPIFIHLTKKAEIIVGFASAVTVTIAAPLQ